jgi:hypothetical protein
MQTKLVEVFQIGSELAGVLDIPENYWPAPGQYLACKRLNDPSESVAHQLFRTLGDEGLLNLSPLPENWQPGDQLLVGSPQGHGFSLPVEARRLALLPYKVSPTRLLPLMREALAQNAAISLFSENIPSSDIMNRLPSVVEVNPISALLENLDWPDFLAVDLARDELEAFSGLFSQETSHLNGQVLVRTSMPCRGLAECGVCSVRTKRGWKYACIDGPVFLLKEVLHVAQ